MEIKEVSFRDITTETDWINTSDSWKKKVKITHKTNQDYMLVSTHTKFSSGDEKYDGTLTFEINGLDQLIQALQELKDAITGAKRQC